MHYLFLGRLSVHHRPRRLLATAALAALVVVSSACSSDDNNTDRSSDSSTTTTMGGDGATAGPDAPIIFNAQGNNLDAYASEASEDGSFATQRVFETASTDPVNGSDINAQICFFPPTDEGEQWFIGGEDTDQEEAGGSAGWGIFRLEGTEVANLKATQLGKLIPTYQPANDNPENYGCGVLSDGRVITTDVGNQASGAGDGQLIIWFPPLTGGDEPPFDDVAYCKLDVTLATAQSVLIRDDEIYVAAARGGVYRYPGPFPTSGDADGGCAGTDDTGAPFADDVAKETFIEPGPEGLATPTGLADAPDNGLYVSSVFTGVINEYGPDGSFRRTILAPPEGEQLGEETYSTGTPLGIGVDADGTLYYADIGIVVSDGGVGPGDKTGSVRRIRFVDGEPQAPETLATDLSYPDGIGVWNPFS